MFGNISCIGVYGCLWMIGLSFCPAQPTNAELYKHLWEQELDSLVVKEIEGQILSEYFPSLALDSTAEWVLRIFGPQIVYTKLGKSVYQRSFTQAYQLEGNGMRAGRIEATDTLPYRKLKTIIRKGPEELAGEDPSLWAKWLKPTVWIVGSSATIVSLFYLRSRER